MGKRIVIALGGNALGNTPYEQLSLVTETAKPIVDLIAQGNEVVIAHGNGQIIAVSEGYKAMAGCRNGVASVKKNAQDSPVVMIED